MKAEGRLATSGAHLLRDRVVNPRSVAESATTTLYRLFNESGEVLYVGISVNGPQRIKQHNGGKEWFVQVASATFTHFPSRAEALKAEADAIRKEKPLYNKAVPHPNPSGYRPRKSRVDGLSDEQVASLETLTQRHFAMEVDEFLIACRTGQLDQNDERMRYVLNFLGLIAAANPS